MDQLKHISFPQALRATGLEGAELGAAIKWDAEGRAKYLQYHAQGSTLDVTEANMTQALLEQAVREGKYVPMCIVIARPFIEHLMMSAVATVSGRDTGATLFGPADMQISANTSVKTIEGESAPSPTAPTAPTTSPI